MPNRSKDRDQITCGLLVLQVGVGLRADNPLSSNLEVNGRKGISKSRMEIVGGSEDRCG